MSLYFYKHHAKAATQELMEFVSAVLPAKKISVMYLDEAHQLGLHFGIVLHLVRHQLRTTKMWYTFMGTESSISHYAPRPSQSQSTTLLAYACLTDAIVHFLRKSGTNQLLQPYIDLGFDQRVIARSKARVTVRMGDMQTIEFISQYGRPMYVDVACRPRLLILLQGGTPFYLKKYRAI